MQNMWISVALIVLIIIVGLIAGTRLSAPGSQKRAVTWAFGFLAALVLLFFIFINTMPGDWIVPLFTVLCIVVPICVYVIISRLSRKEARSNVSSSGNPRLLGKKDFSLPKGSPTKGSPAALQAKAPEGPKPPTAEERAAAEAAAAASAMHAKPAPAVATANTASTKQTKPIQTAASSTKQTKPAPAASASTPSAKQAKPTSATEASAPTSKSKPAAAAQSSKQASAAPVAKASSDRRPEPTKSQAQASTKKDKKTKVAPAHTAAPAHASGAQTNLPAGVQGISLTPQHKSAPAHAAKAEAPIVAQDLHALDKTAEPTIYEPPELLQDVELGELPDALKAPAHAKEATEEIPAIDITDNNPDAIDALRESLELDAKLEAIFDQSATDTPGPKEPLGTHAQEQTSAPAPEQLVTQPAPVASSMPAPSATPAPMPKPEPKPKKQMDPYFAFRAKAAGLSSQGNYAVAAVIYAQAALAAPTPKESRDAKFDELACYVKADDIAKAKSLAAQLRQSSVLTRFERLKLDAVERMS